MIDPKAIFFQDNICQPSQGPQTPNISALGHMYHSQAKINLLTSLQQQLALASASLYEHLETFFNRKKKMGKENVLEKYKPSKTCLKRKGKK